MSVEELLAANEPHWDAERAVCRAYFTSPDRTLDTDLRWLRRQAAKELFDGVEVFTGEQRAEEDDHLRRFVAAYDALRRPDDPPLDRDRLEADVAWPANVALRELRARHRAEHGKLGELAAGVTEGGRGALFAEGAAWGGGVIAEACAAVLADELAHMDAAVVELASLGLSAADWALVVELTVEQSRQRVRMREEQFAAP